MGGSPPQRIYRSLAWCMPACLPTCVFVAGVMLGLPCIAWLMGSPVWYPALSIVLDGAPALFIVGSACLGGLCLVPAFRLGELPIRWHLALGAALGLGAMSLLVLLAGLAGLLQRELWLAILAVALALGILRLRQILGQRPASLNIESPSSADTAPLDCGGVAYLWILACPFLIFSLLAAVNAPGILWSHEGSGYDVLEYHLQMPKEYWHAGSIGYAAHNVYANFPANVEMLYLLTMVLLREDMEAGVTAQMIHLLLGLLTVLGAWVVGRDASPRAGVMSGVAMATAGWLPYLSGLAYVENGLLFSGVCAVGALLRGYRLLSNSQAPTDLADRRARCWILLAGAITGLACGCKYTAVPMLAVPLAVAAMGMPWPTVRKRVAAAAIFSMACLATFSPWLIKNLAMTGNPVFPLANTLFEATPEGWGAAETAQWNEAHLPVEHLRSVGQRVRVIWTQLAADRYQRFGPLLIFLSLGGLALRRWRGPDVILLGLLVVQIGVWVFATHLFARFVVVSLIPMSLLAGRAFGLSQDRESRSSSASKSLVVLMVLGALWNLSFVVALHRAESPGGAPASAIHKIDLVTDSPSESSDPNAYLGYINNRLADDARILMIGDARPFYIAREVDYCVVFNRHPFVTVIQNARNAGEISEWLRSKGYTHVLVHWAEARRLRQTYGFAHELGPALFDDLESHGIPLEREFIYARMRDRYISLFAVHSDGGTQHRD